MGIASPAVFQKTITRLRAELPEIELAVHTHNDFGMATANAIAALECGATWADTTVLGLGERCGCARLEEVAAFLHLAGGNDSIRPDKLKPLAARIAGYLGLEIPDHLPVLGQKIFTCETGLHLQGLQNNPETYEPYSPERVGSTRQLLYGAKTGKKALSHQASSLGITLEATALSEKLHTLRTNALSSQRQLTSSELRSLLRDNFAVS